MCHSVPPNLSFLVDDANEDWGFQQKFDYIHARQLHCTVEEKKMISQAYEYIYQALNLNRRQLTSSAQVT
jgi:hypothetical protein